MADFYDGGLAIVVDEKKGNRHLVRLQHKGKYSTMYGTLDFQDLLDCEDGGYVQTQLGVRYRVLKPTYKDYVMRIKRQAQIIYPKDCAAMLMWGDIKPGQKVLESGIGQGALSIALLRALAGRGTLTTYEIREDFAGQAARFIGEFLGETPNHDIQLRSIYDGIDGEYERIMLDLPEPWHVLPHTKTGLKTGGIIVSYIPTILQVKQYVDRMREMGDFDDIEIFEFTKRPWKVEGLSVRPETWVYNHSAFLVSARKIVPIPEAVKEEKTETVEDKEDTGGQEG